MFFGYEKKVKCAACAVYEEQISYLKGVIKNLTEEKAAERAEYKRAVDALLIKSESPAIGQGYTEPNRSMDPTKLFSFFNEEIEERK